MSWSFTEPSPVFITVFLCPKKHKMPKAPGRRTASGGTCRHPRTVHLSGNPCAAAMGCGGMDSLAKLSYFTHLNLAAIKGDDYDDFPMKNT